MPPPLLCVVFFFFWDFSFLEIFLREGEEGVKQGEREREREVSPKSRPKLDPMCSGEGKKKKK